MTHPEHDDLPSRAWGPPPPAVPAPVETWDDPPDAGPAGANPFQVKVIWKALGRYWWQILLLWAVGSAGALALARAKIRTNYDATAWLIVRSSAPGIFGNAGTQGSSDFLRFMKTQVELVTSPDVLKAALAKHADLMGLPRLAGAEDPEATIRGALNVQIRQDTNLFTVSMPSPDPAEARRIVDAVVDSYLDETNRWAIEQAEGQINRLREEARIKENEIRSGEEKLRKLVDSLGTVDAEALRDRERTSLAQFGRYLEEGQRLQLERIGLEGELEAARHFAASADVPKPQEARDEIDREFRAIPAVAAALEVRAQAERIKQQHGRLAKQASDPALAHIQAQIRDADANLARLRRDLMPRIEKRLADQARASDTGRRIVQELEAALASTRSQEQRLDDLIRTLKVQNEDQSEGGKALEVRFIEEERSHDKGLLEAIQSYINQVEFEAKMPSQVDRANDATQVSASSSKRLRAMMAAPVGVLGLVLGLFVLLELRSGRVADPEELSTRVRVEVMGVVPPLPSLRSSRSLSLPGSRGEDRARRRLDEFVQSLDHLRVALCSGRQGARRCVMITSACSGEGKTTLTAHLAGRCANAGLSTLLIDADMRNPSLSRLLKVPDGPGLSDVLRGELSAEAALTVIEAGGGFQLLPAGTPGFDPSRILQGDRLGHLIGQLRQAFDIILMDTPPVLLVPDALTLGRWVDGALLAVRYDTSRFPLVDRAQRRLAAVGVPVLGAVVNGVRTMDSAYGTGYGYGYSYSSTRSGDPAGPGPAYDAPVGPAA